MIFPSATPCLSS